MKGGGEKSRHHCCIWLSGFNVLFRCWTVGGLPCRTSDLRKFRNKKFLLVINWTDVQKTFWGKRLDKKTLDWTSSGWRFSEKGLLQTNFVNLSKKIEVSTDSVSHYHTRVLYELFLQFAFRNLTIQVYPNLFDVYKDQ